MKKRKINTKQLTAIRPIINHGKKRFYFRYYCPDLQKDNIRKFADTEAEAKVLREQIKEKQVLGPSSPVYGLTFGKLKHIFLSAQQKRAHNKEITKSYLNDFTRRLEYFESIFGSETLIADLQRQAISYAVYNKPSAKTAKTKLEYFVSLKAMFRFAAEEGLLFDTQINQLMPRKSQPKQFKKREKRIPTQDQMHKLIYSRVSWWTDEEYKFWVAFKLLMAATGIRVGEAAAASWGNLHLRALGSNQNRLFIGQARNSDGDISTPKTESGLRDVPIPTELGHKLLELPQTCDLIFPCPKLGKPRGRGFKKTGQGPRLPVANEPRPITPEELWRFAIEPVIQEHDLEWNERSHIIRHFQASKMISLGWDVKKVQKRLGHSRATTTLDTYGHLYDQVDFDEESKEMSRGLV